MTDRVMLVVGGTGSIGRAIVARALEDGWRVIANGRSGVAPDGATVIHADLSKDGAVSLLVERAVAETGRIDAVVDCMAAGPPRRLSGPLEQTEPEGYAPFLDLSVAHVQRLAYAALPHLARQGGSLVAMVSDAGLFAAPGQAVIGAARAATIGFVRNLALEVARSAVRVHCVSSTFVEGTAIIRRLEGASAKRLDRARDRAGLGLPTADDVASAVLFLCGNGARRMTGQVLSINGGLNA